jgi:hypothetical protein
VVQSEADHFQFYLEYRKDSQNGADSSEKILVANFSNWWFAKLRGLKEGFAGLVNSDVKDQIAGRNRTKRPDNLKFLRHAGAYTFVLHSVLQWTFMAPEARSKVKDLITEMSAKLLLIVAAKELSPSEQPKLKDVFNVRIEKLVKDLVEELILCLSPECAEGVFISNRGYEAEGLNYHQGKVIYFILDRLVQTTQGEIFRGVKNKYTEFWQDCSFEKGHPWLHRDFRHAVFKEGSSQLKFSNLTEPSSGAGDEVNDAMFDDDLFDFDESDLLYDEDDDHYAGGDAYGMDFLPGLSVFKTEEELRLSPVVLRYRVLLQDQNKSRQTHWSLRHWPQLKQQFENCEVLLKGLNIEVLDPTAFQVRFDVQTSGEVNQAPSSGGLGDIRVPINWFELHPEYFLKGKPIAASTAQSLARDGVVEHEGKFYLIEIKKLPTYRSLEMFWNKLSASGSEGLGPGARGSRQEHKHQVRRHHVLELLALRKMGIPFQGPQEWQDVCDYFDALSESSGKDVLPPTLRDVLKPYQKVGVHWLWDLYHLKMGGILADDMGLGKTLQTLAFIESLRYHKKTHRSVIVVPVSLVYNWQAEAAKFTPQLKVEVFEPARTIYEDVDVLICTYGLFALHEEKLSGARFNLAFFDEAQNLKNRDTERFSAAEKLEVPLKIALTGTPLENHLGNLYALMAVVLPGALGSFTDFSRLYIKNSQLTEDALVFLRTQLKPLILRRTKEQILKELPPKTETEIKIDFTAKQKEIYKKTALAYSEKITSIIAKEGESRSQLHMLTALLRLRQICSDPNALPGIKFKDVPPKLEVLFERLEQIVEEGHSAIVFTQFMSTFNRIKQMAEEKKLSLLSLCGSDSSKERTRTLSAFSDNTQPAVLLMTLKSGGVGLNLTKASYVFHLEPWWNPAVENQATDRVHRIGQDKSISVYRLLMRESVEEKVEVLKARKGNLFNKMFGENYFSTENAETTEAVAESETASTKKGGRLSKEDFDILLS